MLADDDAPSAITDPLTGAYSRALLPPRLAEELSRASRSGTGCALFLFDVDYFKSVNDAYGHQRGDDILRQMTARINDLIRGYDVLFRYGGDEFVLLLPETDKADAVRVALRLTDGIKSVPFAGEPPLSVSVSLGVAVFPDDAADADELLAAADRRNYLAKHRGRACAVVDDAADSDVPANPTSSRLLERDLPMGATRDFLTRLLGGQRGALGVTGEAGAGYTRFLAEVTRAARLRGFEVTDDSAAAPASDRPVLLVLDELAPGEALPLDGAIHGVVHHGLRGPLPLLDSVELLSWSPAAIRVWLRTTLQAEPSRVLVDWMAARTGGLPAKVEREVARLQANAGLVRDGESGWTVAPALLAKSNRPRRPLPAPLTELVGRQQETAQVARLVTSGRLVTLVGPGGIGKTRLSLAVASAVEDSFEDGVAFVHVATAQTDDEVLAALAHALGVTDQPGRTEAQSVAEYLAEQNLLLVLDNVEQAEGAADVVAELLSAAPGVSVLLSSRQRLGVYGETVYAVPALALPDPDTLPAGQAGVAMALAGSPALALFAARARAVAYDFSVTADTLRASIDLCRRLDGLPLAIELAAAHADSLSPADMLAQLATTLDLPGPGLRGIPERQRTLRGAIDWSVTRLAEEDREVFLRLGAFRDGATLPAVEAVSPAVDDIARRLGALADKSLVRAEPHAVDGVRYVLLETVRAYTVERLPSDAASLHAAYFSAFAATAGEQLTGPDQGTWHGMLDRDYANLTAAFAALELDDAAALAVDLWRFWRGGSHLRDGRAWLDRLLARPDLEDALRARVLHAAAVLAGAQDDHATAGRLAAQSRLLALQSGDARTVAQASNALGIAALSAGDYIDAGTFFAESLERWSLLDEPLGMAMAHGNLTRVALRMGDPDTASLHADRCLELDRAAGNTRGIMLGLLCLGEIRLMREDFSGAVPALGEALEHSRALTDVFGEAMARHLLGLVALADDRRDEALRHVVAAAGLRRDVGDRDDLAISLDTLAALYAAPRPALAARLLGAVEALRERHRLAAAEHFAGTSRVTLLDALGAALGSGGLAVAVDTGRAAGLDVVVDEALEEA